jgi:hypothetical protein
MSKKKEDTPRVLSATVYQARLDHWFEAGGRRGPGVLSREELAAIAWQELHKFFQSGDLEFIHFGKGGCRRMRKWRNQLAWALVQCRHDANGNAVIQRAGSYYYHLDYADPQWISLVKTPRNVKRSLKQYVYVKDNDLRGHG